MAWILWQQNLILLVPEKWWFHHLFLYYTRNHTDDSRPFYQHISPYLLSKYWIYWCRKSTVYRDIITNKVSLLQNGKANWYNDAKSEWKILLKPLNTQTLFAISVNEREIHFALGRHEYKAVGQWFSFPDYMVY